MVKTCTECGVEGGLLSIRNRKLPISSPRLLCTECYNEIKAKEEEQIRKINNWKVKILRRFYEGTLKQFCREKGISTSERRTTTAVSRRGTRYERYVTYYFTYDELVNICVKWIGLNDIIDFAHKKKIAINDVIMEIEKNKFEQEFEETRENETIDDKRLDEVVSKIKEFEPLMVDYPNELPYHVDLARYLKNVFENTHIEIQRGSARPDIIIDNIAIEIKGPTNQRELRTIADKCFRYPQYFDRGLIVVLFDLRVTVQYFNDWKKGLQDKFPNVIVLKK